MPASLAVAFMIFYTYHTKRGACFSSATVLLIPFREHHCRNFHCSLYTLFKNSGAVGGGAMAYAIIIALYVDRNSRTYIH